MEKLSVLLRRGIPLLVVLPVLGVLLVSCAKQGVTTAGGETAATLAAGSESPWSRAGMRGDGSTVPDPRDFVPLSDLMPVHFDFDRYDIRPDEARTLDANAKWMKAHPSHLILVEGHADERGTNEYNLALGERRAKATVNYLIAQGVHVSRMTLMSYGEERPLCMDKSEECWAKNRRGDFRVKLR
ncbi:MAG: peptidoglycan-associated lipoprotein Pal [Candidatus Rokubacteria bacterium]|nr:peptidoglycan-associated lipoprotein Pal [Candidatus Rokubacteria bacterium]